MMKSKFCRAGLSLFFVSFVLYILAGVSLTVDSGNTAKQPQEPVKPAPLAQRQIVKWAKKLDFIPTAGQQTCKEAMEKVSEDVWTPEYISTSKAHLKFLQALNDSQQALSSGRFTDQQMMFAKLTSLPSVRTVCESGFNAGHNALVWLSAKKTTKVISFDQGKNKYSRKAARFLKEKYPTRFNVTWGYTNSTLSKYQRNHAMVKCDVMFVDGGRGQNIIDSDLSVFRLMANDRHLLVLDDYPTQKAELNKRVAPVWESLKRNGVIAELFACVGGGFRGFSLGRFIS